MKRTKTKILSVFLSVCMIISCMAGISVTAYATPAETLLTTLTFGGSSTYSESPSGVVNVTATNVDMYHATYGWCWNNGSSGSLSVTAKEGYTITKCVFHQGTNSNKIFTDTETPFEIHASECRITENFRMDGITSIEVYGYAAPAHDHTWATAWSNDATYHWHACTADGNSDACLTATGAAKAAHTYGDSGDARFTCTVCSYVSTTKQADCTAADNVIGLISAIGTVTYTDTCKNKIDAADTAYEALTTDQKALVTNAGTLSTAKTTYSDLKTAAEKDAAKEDLDGKITEATTYYNSIKDITEYSSIAATLNTAIETAQSAYENASATTDSLSTAKSALETALSTAKSDVQALLDDEVSTAKSALDTARAGKNDSDYDAEDIAALDKAVTDGKAAIENATTAAEIETAKNNAIAAINAVKTKAQKKEAADKAAAQAVTDAINALPAAANVKITDKAAIEAARAAYNAFTAAQKALVSADTLKKLTDAETALAAASDSGNGGNGGNGGSYTPVIPSYTPTTTTPTTNTGKLDNTTDEKKNDNGASLESSNDELSKAVLTDADRDAMAKGENIQVYLEVEEKKPTKAEQQKAEEALAKIDESGEIAMYMDMNLFKKVGSKAPVQIHEVNGKVEVGFKVPEKFINSDPDTQRTFYIGHIKDYGTVEIIKCEFDPETGIATFYTDSFSCYFLIFEDAPAAADTSVEETDDDEDTDTDTGDDFDELTDDSDDDDEEDTNSTISDDDSDDADDDHSVDNAVDDGNPHTGVSAGFGLLAVCAVTAGAALAVKKRKNK